MKGSVKGSVAGGNQGRDIYADERDRKLWLETLGEACAKTAHPGLGDEEQPLPPVVGDPLSSGRVFRPQAGSFAPPFLTRLAFQVGGSRLASPRSAAASHRFLPPVSDSPLLIEIY